MRLWDIQNSIEIARRAVGDLSRADFLDDPVRRFAAERGIEIISEAPRHIPAALRDTFAGSALVGDRGYRQHASARL
jgi:uncharacterized protein with HEPN domain